MTMVNIQIEEKLARFLADSNLPIYIGGWTILTIELSKDLTIVLHSHSDSLFTWESFLKELKENCCSCKLSELDKNTLEVLEDLSVIKPVKTIYDYD